MANPEPHFLVVDDDGLQRRAFRFDTERHGLYCPVHEARNGDEAFDVLKRGGDDGKPLPQETIVLLDVDTSPEQGLAFLDRLRDDPDRGRTVVFVVASGTDADVIGRLYDRGIAGYVSKSTMSPDRAGLIRMLLEYVHLVTLPAVRPGDPSTD